MIERYELKFGWADPDDDEPDNPNDGGAIWHTRVEVHTPGMVTIIDSDGEAVEIHVSELKAIVTFLEKIGHD